MSPRNALKQVYIISEGGKLIYYKDFIGGGASPEIIAGFLSAFSSFFKEAFKSEPRELLIADQKVFFNKLSDEVFTVILTDAKSDINDFKPFFQIISREVAQNLSMKELNYTSNASIAQKIESVISEALIKRIEEKRIKTLSADEVSYILSKIIRGIPSFIRAVNLGERIAVLGSEEEVKKTVRVLKSMLKYKHSLKVIEYSSKFKHADIIGLPYAEKTSIPANYYVLDLSTGVFSPQISSKDYDKIFKKLKPPFDESILKRLATYFEYLPKVKKAFLNRLRKGGLNEAWKLLEQYTLEERELFLDHVISNDSVLRALREYSKYIPLDVLKTFNKNLIILNNKVFYKNKLSVEESLKLIKELHKNALDYLSESKVKQLKENLEKTLF